MSDFNVLEHIFGFLSSGTTGAADPLEYPESFEQDQRRTDFGHTYGSSNGKYEPQAEYIPGTLDDMARQQGIASDDPYQLEAKLEAWRGQRNRKDQQRLKDYLER